MISSVVVDGAATKTKYFALGSEVKFWLLVNYYKIFISRPSVSDA